MVEEFSSLGILENLDDLTPTEKICTLTLVSTLMLSVYNIGQTIFNFMHMPLQTISKKIEAPDFNKIVWCDPENNDFL